MSIKTLSTTLAFVLAAGAATAQAVPAGNAQLAASAGVASGVYSNAQLVQLIEARRDNDAAKVAFILAQGSVEASRADFGAVSPVAGSAGLSATDLILLDEARKDNDTHAMNYILSGADRSTTSDASVVTPAEAQLAGIVGVDPAQYTLIELVAMQPKP